MTKPQITAESIWQALQAVKDPEIPVVSVVEMGIVRDVQVSDDGKVQVIMTPTFSGCPALEVMKRDIAEQVHSLGVESVEVEAVLSPPWTTDWIQDEAREKLRLFGLMPPPRHGGNLISVAFLDVITCPRCGSNNTVIKNTFGSTLCRAIWYCHECQDAFEQFKPL
jgi:ring-1,2-phenylacetyl-CoA epoxidase subunit PaaD